MGDMSATTETTGQPGPLRFARMAGSSIAGRDAAPWVTDFLNAAYYRRAVDEREVDDLRFAFGVLTTYWYRDDTRAAAARHRPAGVPPRLRRASASTPTASARGTLSRDQLLERGAAQLLGDWFPEAYADDARRGWGIGVPDGRGARGLRPRAPPGARASSAS